jgi:uncharacterized protein YndB with AHSA1/START domain
MHHSIDISGTLDGTVESIWRVWTDMAAYPDWDPREEETRLDGPFAPGTTGWSKQRGRRPGSPFEVTLVEPMSRWTNELPLPGGRLVIDHHLEALDEHRVRVAKTYTAHGPMSVLFALVFQRGIRREMPGTWAALEAEAARRSAVA